jgi:hypothetical protein
VRVYEASRRFGEARERARSFPGEENEGEARGCEGRRRKQPKANELRKRKRKRKGKEEEGKKEGNGVSEWDGLKLVMMGEWKRNHSERCLGCFGMHDSIESGFLCGA